MNFAPAYKKILKNQLCTKGVVLSLLLLLAFPLTFLGQTPLGSFSRKLDRTDRSLNQYSLTFLQAWMERGIVASRMRLVLPLYVSQPGVGTGYNSYPAGFLLPAYVAIRTAHLFGQQRPAQEVRVLRILASLNHLVLAFLTAFTVLILSTSLSASLLSAFLCLFLPPMLIWQHNIWWPDTAGLTWAALLVFLCTAESRIPFRELKHWNAVFFAISFFSCNSDWYPHVAVATLSLFLRRERAISLWLGMLCALLVHLGQIFFYGSLSDFYFKFSMRTGLAASPDSSSIASNLSDWLRTGLPMLFGWPIFAALFLFAAGLALPRNRDRSRLLGLLLISVLLHWILLSEHYPNHLFNTVRWSYLVALLPALFPLAAQALLIPAGALWVWACLTGPNFTVFGPKFAADHAPESLEACDLVRNHRTPGRAFLARPGSVVIQDGNFINYFPMCKTLLSAVHANGEPTLSIYPEGKSDEPAEYVLLTPAGEKPTDLEVSGDVAHSEHWSLWKLSERQKGKLLRNGPFH